MRRTFIALAGALLSLSSIASARSALWTSPSTSATDPDTLEIRMFLVQFKADGSSSSGITGNGTFGSDTGSYGLENPGWRKGNEALAHAGRILRFAQDYWSKASSGRLVIVPRIYPAVLSLGQTMNHYTIPSRQNGENKTAYWNRAEARLLGLAGDAVRLAAAQDSTKNPFFASLPPAASKRKVVFACMHAGINRSTDGGVKGSAYANSQRDLLDFYINPADFKLLASSTDTSLHRSDSLGIPVTIGGIPDTLKHLMLLPEAMSQDGLNWGLAGLLNQEIGSALGLPFTSESGVRDPSPSVLGTWDLMDAGSSAGQGFLPSLPMAWHRLYLGWATAVTLKAGTAVHRSIPAVRPGRDTVFVVPLDGGEYLLIENRQRGDSGISRVTQLDPASNDAHTVAIAPDSVSYLFSDSLYVGGKGSPNPKRLKGYLASAGVDAGLPGSGLLVWKVNEWLLQEYLSAQNANPWQGDSLQDHYRGITLLQASGKTTLGQRLKNSTGETVLDYGSGSDVLPHIHRHLANGKENSRDTVSVLPSVGYVSTQTSTGARTLITLTSKWPAAALGERGELSLVGDSVITPGAPALNLEISWGRFRAPQDSLYPIQLPAGLKAYSFLPGPTSLPKSSWIIDTTGHVQLLDSMGRVDARFGPLTDTLVETGTWANDIDAAFANAAKNSQTRRIAVQDLSGLKERPIGTAAHQDTLAVATRSHIALVWLQGGTATAKVVHPAKPATSPMAIDGSFYFADSNGRLCRASTFRVDTLKDLGLPGHLQALCQSDSNGAHQIYAVDDSARVSRYDISSKDLAVFPAALAAQLGETFSVASADFDRDSVNDVLILGSRGSAAILSGKTRAKLPGWPKIFARGGSSSSGDSGLPALADLDGSGYPQVLFTGTDRLWLVDKNGVSPAGWPVHVTGNDPVNQSTAGKRFPAGVFGSSPLVVSLDGDTTRKEVLLGSPDGQIFAFTGSGTAYAGVQSATAPGSGAALGYSVTSWPLAAGSRTGDSTRCPWLHVFAQGERLNSLSSLQGLDLFHIDSAKTFWGLPGGSASRGFFLDLSTAAAPSTSTSLSNFHFYPNPIRSGRATVRYDLGSDASSVKLEIYDQTSYVALQKSDLPTTSGRQAYLLDGLHLGTGVYVARLTVEFPGQTRSSWFRLAVAK
jgi:M6 family metalloprotease-like protein